MENRKKYTVKHPCFYTFSNNTVLVELNRGQKWELVWHNDFTCEICRAGVTLRIEIANFEKIFGEE